MEATLLINQSSLGQQNVKLSSTNVKYAHNGRDGGCVHVLSTWFVCNQEIVKQLAFSI